LILFLLACSQPSKVDFLKGLHQLFASEEAQGEVGKLSSFLKSPILAPAPSTSQTAVVSSKKMKS